MAYKQAGMPARGVTRRRFLTTSVGTGVAGSAAVLGGGASVLFEQVLGAATASWIEKSIPQLQSLMASGALSSRELTLGYLQRIADLNPLLHAVIETNPEAVAIAARRDAERRGGLGRGPLHGIPILLQDNVGTRGTQQTTAGAPPPGNNPAPGGAALGPRRRRA